MQKLQNVICTPPKKSCAEAPECPLEGKPLLEVDWGTPGSLEVFAVNHFGWWRPGVAGAERLAEAGRGWQRLAGLEGAGVIGPIVKVE